MNPNPHNPVVSESSSAEETLRLIATLPVPAALEDHVHAALRSAPRQARVLPWPRRLNPQSSWMRSAAAAAIVFVVVGGGWGVYSRVERNLPAKVIIMPAHMPAAGGFSNAGAMRTPETLPGPVAPRQPKTLVAQAKKAKKPVTSLKQPGSAGSPAAMVKSGTQNGAAK